jgi:hypothetical protein
MGTISREHCHLLILDDHGSLVRLEVARTAMEVGVDLLSLPSHISHALQPLDVVVFKPFKQNFRNYCNFWMSQNMKQPATKEILAHWLSLLAMFRVDSGPQVCSL